MASNEKLKNFVYHMGIEFIVKLSMCFSDVELEALAAEFEIEADLSQNDEGVSKSLRNLAEICRIYKEF